MNYDVLVSIKKLCYSLFQLVMSIILLSVVIRVDLSTLEKNLMLIAIIFMILSNGVGIFLKYKKH
ncbi:MAG: hypothetical protein ACLUG9_16860 [Paraclostridium sordellii]